MSRTRWLATKLGLVGLASMAAAGLFSLLVTWSASRIDKVNMNWLQPSVFSERGIAPIGYAAFAFVLGVLAGILIRRTVPAMAVTLVVFTAVQFAMRALRGYLIAPLHLIVSLSGPHGAPIAVQGGWQHERRPDRGWHTRRVDLLSPGRQRGRACGPADAAAQAAGAPAGMASGSW